MAEFKLTEEVRKGGMWVVAFVGVCILVGLGKLKPETIEYLLFALMGQVAGMSKPGGNKP
jgi:hypothetical protein